MIPVIKEPVAGGINDYTKVPVVRFNQPQEPPEYPYIGYTIITPESKNKGTYGVYEDGVDRKPVTQTWSITSKSDKEDESVTNALKAHEYLDHAGRLELKLQGIIVQSITPVQNRDNILASGFEYSNGFDVVFSLMDEVKNRVVETQEYIEDASITPIIET